MRAPTARNLCTLSNLFRSKLLTRKRNTNVVPFTKPSPESEDEMYLSSEPYLARDTSQGVFFFKFQFLRLPMFSFTFFVEVPCCVNGFWFLELNELEKCWALCCQMRWFQLFCFVLFCFLGGYFGVLLGYLGV